ILTGIGAMDLRMAARAVALGLETQTTVGYVRCCRSHVASEAKLALLPAGEQRLVRAAMRCVAGCAAFHFHGGVFEHHGSTLFGVAADAGFPTGLRERRPIRAFVGGMAIGALDGALRHAMVLRQ